MKDVHLISKDTLTFQDKTFRCAIGANGFVKAADRKEGSLTTPIGRFALRECWYRADRMEMPLTVLQLCAIKENDGWCNDPKHPLYNRAVKLPIAASHEKLWRDDAMYDIVVPLGFNDDPVIPGKGSAIFLHVAKPDYSPTEGCIALALEDLQYLLSEILPETHIVVEAVIE